MSTVSAPRPASQTPPARSRAARARSQAETAAGQVAAELRRLTGRDPAAADVWTAQPRRGALVGKSTLHLIGQGLLQPLHAALLLKGDRELLVAALVPAALLLAF